MSINEPRQHYSTLIREHHRMALVYAQTLSGNEHTARDLAQEAFLVGWQNWSKFDITRDFAAWIRGIIRNKWREFCRKESRTVGWDEEALSQLEATVQEVPQSDFFEKLQNCLTRLPETLSACIKAHYFELLSTAETAAKLETSEAATRKRLQRAREALKSCLAR